MEKVRLAIMVSDTEFLSMLDPEMEPHVWLSTLKRKISHKFSWKSGNALMELLFLIIYLYSLGRISECLNLLVHISQKVEFNGNYNLWTPAGFQLCLLTRIFREGGESQKADETFQVIKNNPFQLPDPVLGKLSLRDVRNLKSILESKSQRTNSRELIREIASDLLLPLYLYEAALNIGYDSDDVKKRSTEKLSASLDYGFALLGQCLHGLMK